MKKIVIVFILIFLFTACSTAHRNEKSSYNKHSKQYQIEQNEKNQEKLKEM